MSAAGSSGPQARQGIARCYSIIEDIVYLGLGLLLAGIVLALLVAGFISFGRSALSWSVGTNIIGLLDHVLLILLIVELLYTVQVSFREHGLVPEPFLLVGLISVIRRVLVLTAEFGAKQAKQEEISPSLVLELAVLAGLILALAISLVLLRKKGGPVAERA